MNRLLIVSAAIFALSAATGFAGEGPEAVDTSSYLDLLPGDLDLGSANFDYATESWVDADGTSYYVGNGPNPTFIPYVAEDTPDLGTLAASASPAFVPHETSNGEGRCYSEIECILAEHR